LLRLKATMHLRHKDGIVLTIRTIQLALVGMIWMDRFAS
jgi:hypothetical protein